jgi:hypothetical protein
MLYYESPVDRSFVYSSSDLNFYDDFFSFYFVSFFYCNGLDRENGNKSHNSDQAERLKAAVFFFNYYSLSFLAYDYSF